MRKQNLFPIRLVVIIIYLLSLSTVFTFVLRQPAAASEPTWGDESDWIYVSFQVGGVLENGLTFDDEDILSYKVATDEWYLYFDGSDVGLGGDNSFDIDAFHRLHDGTLLFSFLQDTTIPDVGAVDDADLVRFIPTSPLGRGETSGTFAMYFDGSDVGLEAAGEDIDAVTLTADGRLVISTRGVYDVGFTGDGTDLLAFTPTSLGENTTGTWALNLDGAAVGLDDPTNESIWGVWIHPHGGALYLKASGAFSMSGISGDGPEVFTCAPPDPGLPITSCQTAGIYWEGMTNSAGTMQADALMVIPYSPPGPICWLCPEPGTAVFLEATIAPSTAYAGDHSLALTVEARDANGLLAPSYRGKLNIDPSVSVSGGLPQGPIGGVPDYTFTEADAGRHVFSDFGFNVDGTQTIMITDRDVPVLHTTSNAVLVEPVWLSAAVSPTTAFAGEPILSLIVEAQDINGDLVPGYRGALNIDASANTSGLPQGPIAGIPDYTFTAADAGRHVFPDFAFHTAGAQSITITDRGYSSRNTTTNAVNIQEVHLHASVVPTSAYVYQKVLTLTVEARDASGNLVPGYRGALNINPSADTMSLPQGPIGGVPDYTFTAADEGHHDFPNFAFTAAQTQTITVIDRGDTSRQITATTFITDVAFHVSLHPNPIIISDTGTLNVLVTDPLITEPDPEDRIPDFYGSIVVSSTLSHSYQEVYDFAAEDEGGVQLPIEFYELGQGLLQIVDDDDITRHSDPITVTVITPSLPVTIPAVISPPPYNIPPPPPPASVPLSWGLPFVAKLRMPSNNWKGAPDYAVPAKPGALYIIQGFSRIPPESSYRYWIHYACSYLGWEDVLTNARYSGGGIDGGPNQENDPTVFAVDPIGCTDGGNLFKGETFVTMSPRLAAPAPEGTQGVHLTPAIGGNIAEDVEAVFTANASFDDDMECDSTPEAVSVGDPIDTRTGAFYLTEQDLGMQTGCDGVWLRFERSYHSLSIGEVQNPLGPHWVHNYQQQVIDLGNGYIAVRRPRGSYLLYQDIGGGIYATRGDIQHRLVKRPNNEGWAFIYPTQQVDLFDSDGRLIAQQDPHGNLIWMTYETYTHNGKTSSRLARVDAPGGRYLWFGYDYYEPQRLILAADSSGRRVEYAYNGQGYLAAVSNALGATTTYEYENDFLATQTNPMGIIVFDNTYDGYGRVLTQTNSQGENLTLTYVTDSGGITTTVTAQPTGAQTTYAYNLDGLLRQVIDPLGAATHYRAYNSSRQPTIIENAQGQQTHITYDNQARPIAVTNALSQTITVVYDEVWGWPTAYTDTLGLRYQLEYDGPNLVQVTDPAGHSQHFVYADQGNWHNLLTAVVNQAGLTTTLSYNEAGDIETITNDRGGVTHLAYNGMGQPAAVVDMYGFTTTYQYDALGRLTAVSDPLSSTLTLDYNDANEVTAVAFAGLEPLALTYDETSGQLVQMEQGERIWHYVYNNAGELIEVQDPLSRSVYAGYDLLGQVISHTLPGQQQVEYAYDELGRITAVTPPGRPAHAFAYTAIGQPAQYDAPGASGGSDPVTYHYNTVGQFTGLTAVDGLTLTVDYDQFGRLHSVHQAEAAATYAYDTDNGALSQIITTDGTTLTYGYEGLLPTTESWQGVVSGTVHHTYDEGYRLTAESINSSATIPFTYDAAGRLVQAGDLSLSRHPQTGLVQSTTLGSVTDNRLHNNYGEITAYQAASGGTDILTIHYTLDDLGRITDKVETAAGTTITSTYTYEASGRLIQVEENGLVTAAFTYDANGNRLSATMSSGGTLTATYNAQDQLLTYGSHEYTYVGYGFLHTKTDTTNNDTTIYDYDALGNLTHVTLPDGTEIDYLHDGRNRRIGKQVDGILVQGFLYKDQYEPIAQVDAAGQVVARFIYASTQHVPDYMIKDGTSYRLITDHLGSPRFVIDTSSGAILQQMQYDVWGNVTLDTNPGFQPFGFAGGLYDADTGLVRFGARDYDPESGRWTAKDPLGFTGGDTNLYNYVWGDPVNWIDQTGQSPLVIAGGAAVSAGLEMYNQLEANGWNTNCIDWTDVAVAGVVGAASGAVGGWAGVNGPFAKAGVGALTGGASGGIKYTARAVNHGRQWDAGGFGRAVGRGAFIGGTSSFVGSSTPTLLHESINKNLAKVGVNEVANEIAPGSPHGNGCQCEHTPTSRFVKSIHDHATGQKNDAQQMLNALSRD